MGNDYRQGQGGMLTFIKIAFRNIFRNGRRTAFCVVAVGVAVFFITFYSGFIDGMLNSMNETVQIFEIGHVQGVSAQYEAESELMPVQYPVAEGKSLAGITEQIRAIPGVKAALPRIKAYATLQEASLKHATLWGVRMTEETKVNYFNLTDRGDGLLEGRYPAPLSNECAVGLRFAEKTGLKIGDRIPLKTVSAQFSDKLWSPTVTGIFRFDFTAADQDYIIVDFDRLQRLLVLDDESQQIIVYAENPAMSTRIADQMKGIMGRDDRIIRWQDQLWIAMMAGYKPMFTVIFLIFLVVACFLIVNTITMIIHERIKEIGMMGSLGMTRREIVMTFFFESLFLAMFGATVGVFLGGIVTGILQNTPIRWTAMMGESAMATMPLANTIFVDFSLPRLCQNWLMGVVVTSIFTLFPSIKSAWVEPVEALRR